MSYFAKKEYSVRRELIDTMRCYVSPSSCEKHIYSFDTFEKAFDFFEKMYKMDKAVFRWIQDRKSNIYYDESKKSTSYSFSVGNYLLTVKMLNMDEIAKDVFKFQGD